MRSRKNKRQTASVRAEVEQATTDLPAQADAFSTRAQDNAAPVENDAPAPAVVTNAAHVSEPEISEPEVSEPYVESADMSHAAEAFDANVDGPEAQLAEPVVDPEIGLDAKGLFAHLRQRVLDTPNDVTARIRLGQLHDKRTEPLLALEQYQAAVTAEPDNSVVVLQFAQALTTLNRFAEAERELRRVLRLEPDNGGLHLQLGTISFRRGLYSQAEVELKRALELLPDVANAYFHRGESLNQLSRIDEALDMLERGVALDPTYSRAYYIMGILYDRKSRPQEAGAMYKKAREVSGT